MKCDHLIGRTFNGEVYVLASEAMEAIADLKKKLQDEHDFGMHIARCADHDDEKRYAEIAQLQAMLEERNREVGELKANLEDAKATAYAESVDAGMRERRLKRALYKACANWADVEVFERTVGIDDPNVEANRWALMRNKCLKKAEEYK